MRKLFIYLVVLALFILSLFLAGSPSVIADSTYTWTNQPALFLKEIAETSSEDIPSTLYWAGNIDCTMDRNDNCAVNTAYGPVYNSSLNVNGKWVPIKDYGSNSANFYAIPNSSTSITSSSAPVFGAYLYFTHNTYPALTPVYITPSGTPISGVNQRLLSYFKLNHAPDKPVVDRHGSRLAADMSSLAFSGNSRWMIVTDPNIATLRVNIDNGSVMPFGKAFIYGSGLNPVPKNAISNSGRFAVIATPDGSTFNIYDLSACESVPDSITKSVSCKSRDLIKSGFIGMNIPGFSGVQYLRFIDEDSIIFYATYQEHGIKKYGKYILSLESGITNQIQYMALGDSYISGEGAFSYIEGTDTHDNRCHVSSKSYTAIISSELNFDSYHSVACSGATTKDIIDTSEGYRGQAVPHDTRAYLENNRLVEPILTNFGVGYIDQLDFVARYHPRIINLSIGGNDMGFSNILKSCVVPSLEESTCYSTFEDRLELVRLINNDVYPKLVNTYQTLRVANPIGSKIYVIGYPQIAKPGGNCAVNVHLNAEELEFSEQLIDYLDNVIQQAAQRAGVYYVDTRDALYGHRLCEAGSGEVAVNGLTAGNDNPSKFIGPIGDESYHPNQLGYRLLAEKILALTNNLQAPMPAANPHASLPSESNLEILNVPTSGRPVQNLVYAPEMSEDSVYRGETLSTYITGSNYNLTSDTTFQAELHSSPIPLGAYTTSVDGSISAQIYMPIDTPVGYHTLHLIGKDVAGQPVDIFKYLYVGGTPQDLDGNGVSDSNQACVGIEPSGQDYDQDGIDDACDGFIGNALITKTGIFTNHEQQSFRAQNPVKHIPPTTNLVAAQTSSKSKVLGEVTSNLYRSGVLPEISAQGKTNLPILIVGISVLVLIVSVMVVKLL